MSSPESWQSGLSKNAKLLFQDPGWLRPYLVDVEGEAKPRSVVTVNGLVCPSLIPAKLRKEQWMEMDKAAIVGYRHATPVLSKLVDVAPRGPDLGFHIQGVGRTTLEYNQKGPEPHEVNESDAPIYKVNSVPLPFTYSNVPDQLHDRLCQRLEQAGYYVGEIVEKAVVETLQKEAANPQPPKSVTGMLMWLQEKRHFSPYAILGNHFDPDWHQHYSSLMLTLESQRIPEKTTILLQATKDVFRIVIALQFIVVQWNDHFKVITITVPNVVDNTGIVRGA